MMIRNSLTKRAATQNQINFSNPKNKPLVKSNLASHTKSNSTRAIAQIYLTAKKLSTQITLAQISARRRQPGGVTVAAKISYYLMESYSRDGKRIRTNRQRSRVQFPDLKLLLKGKKINWTYFLSNPQLCRGLYRRVLRWTSGKASSSSSKVAREKVYEMLTDIALLKGLRKLSSEIDLIQMIKNGSLRTQV
ncbi:Hypothetical_protein [Hexamita inflata]|uniref:Hypothetical_protein n=1 Tax=Hexamita inflata TaxID=28002 RepID=A0AA86QRS5_9EUKA|nr:Hypothetical protein HINF_LOCUS44515 [Hexamita inflata]